MERKRKMKLMANRESNIDNEEAGSSSIIEVCSFYFNIANVCSVNYKIWDFLEYK